ncbi:hypothetical protein TKK_0002972 [Trichogramma kaykai]
MSIFHLQNRLKFHTTKDFPDEMVDFFARLMGHETQAEVAEITNSCATLSKISPKQIGRSVGSVHEANY